MHRRSAAQSPEGVFAGSDLICLGEHPTTQVRLRSDCLQLACMFFRFWSKWPRPDEIASYDGRNLIACVISFSWKE